VATLGPSPSRAAAATVLLHGRGRTTEEMLALAERIALPEMAWLAVDAPGQSWYPQSFLAKTEDNEPHLGNALARVMEAVRDLEGQGVPRERIAFLGFSQGACLAAHFVYLNPARWGALVALTGGAIGPPDTAFPPLGALDGTPVLLTTAAEDTWVPPSRVYETAAALGRMGALVETRVRPGAEHIVDDEELARARALLAGVVATAR
jgi:phospholipase/carboxylesterase